MSRPTVGISFSYSVEQLTADLGATLGQIDKAKTRAISKLRRWLQTQLSREFAAVAGIRQKAIKSRFKHHIHREGKTLWANIWIGVNPIDAHLLGKPRQTRRMKGTRVHQHFFDKAFFVNVFGDEPKVWKRKDKRRFPVIKVQLPIAEEMEQLLEKYERPAELKLAEIFEHELKFEMGWFK